MSRRPGQHAKSTSGYDARHARPGMPGPAALIGTAAKAVPTTLVVGAAGSALALSGAASVSAATAIPGSPGGAAHLTTAHLTTAHLTTAQAALPRALAPRVHIHHVRPRSTYTVRSGDTLSRISGRFCGTAADFPALAAASGISNPDMIYPGQAIKLDCHAAVPAHVTAARGRHAHRPDRHADRERPAGAHRAPGRHSRHPAASHSSHFSTAGMAAFESCVISRESGGNPRAVNPYSDAGGLFQFLPSTWAGLGYADAYPGGAQTAPVGVQEDAFNKLYAEAGTSPWGPYDGC
jgi:hypothetical protein